MPDYTDGVHDRVDSSRLSRMEEEFSHRLKRSCEDDSTTDALFKDGKLPFCQVLSRVTSEMLREWCLGNKTDSEVSQGSNPSIWQRIAALL